MERSKTEYRKMAAIVAIALEAYLAQPISQPQQPVTAPKVRQRRFEHA
jgi:hypothetical protein